MVDESVMSLACLCEGGDCAGESACRAGDEDALDELRGEGEDGVGRHGCPCQDVRVAEEVRRG